MDTILYPDFLEDITSYQAVSDFWQVKLDPLFRELGLSKQNYLNTTMVNGVALQDGNPIYQAFFPELKKAVRIIQEEPLLPAVASYLVNQIQGTKNQIF
jgi:hypothetical protein